MHQWPIPDVIAGKITRGLRQVITGQGSIFRLFKQYLLNEQI